MKLFWQQIPSPIITEIFCSSSFDGVVLDLEHGHFNNETLYSCIQVGTLLNKTVLARVSHLDRQVIRMCLDANISGIILSTVETFEEAKEFYDYCIYPYEKQNELFKTDNKGVVRKNLFTETGGNRGQGLVRENMWGAHSLKFRRPLIIPQIETVLGVENINDISQLDFDYFLVGPYDLSASIGDIGNFNSPTFISCINKLKSQIGKKIGFHLPSNVQQNLHQYIDYNF